MSDDGTISDEEQPKLIFLGRNLLQIPCFRKSILYGVGGGIGVGLAAFLATSRPSLAMNVAFGSYFAITMSYFVYCRYDHMILTKNAISAEQLFRQHGIRGRPFADDDDDDDDD